MYHEKWRALGSEAAVFLADADDVAGRAQANEIKDQLGAFEKRFSRFLPESELSRLNAASGKEFASSGELIAILIAARELYRETGGIFEPLILPQLINAGYGVSWGSDTPAAARDLSAERHHFDEVIIDEDKMTVFLPVGARIDLGGIGKGYAADEIAEGLGKSFKNFWISLGGDIRFGGDFNGGPWMVGVQDPFAHEKDIFDVEVGGEFRAVATSGTTKRRFREANGAAGHHIIDPRTGRPASSGIVAATVVVDSAMRADVLAKTALILGAQAGVELINKLSRAECLLIDEEGGRYFDERGARGQISSSTASERRRNKGLNTLYFSDNMRAFIKPLK